MDIIQDNYIDEEEARKFLQNLYSGVELLPGVPKKLSIEDAAAVLNVSIPTIERMIADDLLELSKDEIIKTIMENFLSEEAVFEDEKQPSRHEFPQEKTVKNNVENKCKIHIDDQQNLFSDEDLWQE